MSDTVAVERPHGAAPAAVAPLLEIEGIRKAFPGVVALDDVRFRLRAGTVHALMGENGAGKSTLMKIIAGIYVPDQGEVRIKGRPLVLNSPLDALNNGIAMIHQELNLMPYMTVAENIWIRREPKTRLGFVDHGELRRRTQALFDRLVIDIDPEAEVRSLSIASRQMVEIAKAVSFDSDVLIMDEPTSALTETEVAHLFRIIRQLRSQGKGIVYITHKMNELFEIADEVSVFRDGKYIGTRPTAEVTRDEVIRMMVGREVTQLFPKETVPIGDVVLSVRNLAVKGIFGGVSFDVRAGEILGLAGLVGSGRTELARAVFGVDRLLAGTVRLNGEALAIALPRDAIDRGIYLVPEDRKRSGLLLEFSIAENISLPDLGRHARATIIQSVSETANAEQQRHKLNIKTPSVANEAAALSGGNQQKVVLAKWLSMRPSVMIFDEPTRGIDVGAKNEIYELMRALADGGVAILMISSDMEEVIGVSDRVAVMCEGAISGFLERSRFSEHNILQLAVGNRVSA